MVINILPRRARKKAETRERIVAAGLEVFARKGIVAATIDEIAFAADVGKGTIYNYFRTKEDIVVAFLVSVEHDVQREVARLTVGRASLETTLARYILFQFERKAEHHAFVQVFLAQMCVGKAQTDWLTEIQTVIDPPLIRLLESLQKRGLMRSDVDMGTLTGSFKVMQLGLTMLWAMNGPAWRELEEVVRMQVRLFCSGVEVP
jgi:AcrR family transcriptional regulator